MGIAKLASGLKQINAIESYDSSLVDNNNKISANRVYMDFISIAYRIQDAIVMELNSLLYSLLLINEGYLVESEFYSEFVPSVKKYRDLYIGFEHVESVLNNSDTTEKKMESLRSIINSGFISAFKQNVRNKDVVFGYVYVDIINFIFSLLANKLSDVEYILIAFDGIPSFAKIQEQRHRRYMRYSFMEFQRQLKHKQTDYKLRDIYDKDHFESDVRNAIEYVNMKCNKGDLKSDILEKTRSIHTSLKSVEIIKDEYGEGEKILIDKLIQDQQNKNIGINKSYVFYSPDGDSVVLALNAYILTKSPNLYVVKNYVLTPTKENNNQCQYVSIPVLYQRLIERISEYSGLKLYDGGKHADNCCRDWMFVVLSLFGNDFLHCVPTLDINTTWIDMLYIYGTFIKDNSTIITEYDNGTRMNVKLLKKWIIYCAKYEEMLSLDSCLGEIDNRKKIVNTFGSIFTHNYIIDYREKVGFFKKTLSGIAHKLSKHDIIKVISDGIENLNKYTTVTGITYGSIFVKHEMHGNVNNYADMVISNNIPYPSFIYKLKHKTKGGLENIDDVIRKVERPFIAHNGPIYINDVPISQTKTIEDFDFIYRSIRGFIPHNQMPTTSYDIDLFLLEWRMGKWKHILNAHPYDLCYNFSTNKVVPIENEMVRYQKKFLKINDSNIKKMIKNYLQGIFWIHDYYTNPSNDFISTWSYKYERGPFFSHVAHYLNEIDVNHISKNISNAYFNSLIKIKDYIGKETHNFYIYPLDKDELVRINEKYKKSFPDIKHHVTETISGNYNKYFDCRLCPYFSKCIFYGKKLTFVELLDAKNEYDLS